MSDFSCFPFWEEAFFFLECEALLFLEGLPTLFKKTKHTCCRSRRQAPLPFAVRLFLGEACRPLFSKACLPFFSEACRPFIKRGEAPRVNERKRIFSFLFLFFLLTLLLLLNLTLILTLTLLLIFYPLYNLPLLLNGEIRVNSRLLIAINFKTY